MLRWKIGAFTITSVVESEAPTSPRFLFADLDKKAVLAIAGRKSWLSPNFVSPEGFLLQKIHALVIDGGGRRIIVDTCIGNDKERHNPGWAHLQGPFLDDLTAAGYPPESIDTVICTHLHVDHVGWNTKLVDGRWVPTFPNARYLFVKPEFEHWQVAPDINGDETFADSVAPIHEAGLADLVSTSHEVCPGIHYEPTPGHTPGHVSLVIESEGQRAVITGDMIHTPLQIAAPEHSSMFDTDPDMARHTRKAFLDRWSDASTLIIGTHFGSPTAGTLTADGDGAYTLHC